MLFLWFLLLLSWPVAEIAIFVQAGQAIGWAGTILLTIATAIGGSYLMQVQGFTAMNRFLQGAEKGEVPVAAVLDGMGIFAAGLLLLLPGFLSDFLGILLFIPPFRRWVTRLFFRQVLAGNPARYPPGAGRSRPGPRTRPEAFRKSEDVVDAEFETVQPEAKAKAEPSLADQRGTSEPGKANSSPWRPDPTE